MLDEEKNYIDIRLEDSDLSGSWALLTLIDHDGNEVEVELTRDKCSRIHITNDPTKEAGLRP